jgi:hypothetical protein
MELGKDSPHIPLLIALKETEVDGQEYYVLAMQLVEGESLVSQRFSEHEVCDASSRCHSRLT